MAEDLEKLLRDIAVKAHEKPNDASPDAPTPDKEALAARFSELLNPPASPADTKTGQSPQRARPAGKSS